MLFSLLQSVLSLPKYTRDIQNLSAVLIPVNINHSSSWTDYRSRAPITREEFLFFVGEIQNILSNTLVHTTAYLEEVCDNFRGDVLLFILFSQDMRCNFGWNHYGVYVSPVKHYPMFGMTQWSNQDYVSIGDALRHLMDIFPSIAIPPTLNAHPVTSPPTSLCKSLYDALTLD